MIGVDFQWEIAIHHSFLINRSNGDNKCHRIRQSLGVGSFDQETNGLSGSMVWSAWFVAIDENHDHSSIGPHSESPKLSDITSFEPRFPTTLSHEPLGFVLTTHNFSESSRLKESDGVIGSSWIATWTIRCVRWAVFSVSRRNSTWCASARYRVNKN